MFALILSRITIAAHDLPAMMAYYDALFGCGFATEGDSFTGRLAGVTLCLRPGAPEAKGRHSLELAVPDLAGMLRRAADIPDGQSVAVHERNGVRGATLRDPDGNVIELVEQPARVEVTLEDPRGEAAVGLVRALTRDLAARYPEDARLGNADFKPDDVLTPGGAFVVARLGGRVLGCGAIKPFDATTAEVKRMYTDPAARGRGVARAVLEQLEVVARQHGYTRLVLETGDRNPEAIRLYERSGYTRMSCYPPYEASAWSVCFEKRL